MPHYDLICSECKNEVLDIFHSIHVSHPPCEKCGAKNESLWRQAPSVVGDDIPGGVLIQHGICNEDGTPKRYYSKTDIKRAAFEKGLTHGYDTPKPNPRLEDARAAAKEKR